MSTSLSALRSTSTTLPPTSLGTRTPSAAKDDSQDDRQLRAAFDQFVGETLYGQLLKSMRRTVGKPAYFHGGRAEEVFTQQFDQVLAEKFSKSHARTFSGPMYDLFTLQRK